MTFEEFFGALTGHEPFPYQRRLGTEPWPELLDVPTGLGKTAAVGVAWLWKRREGDDSTPRRLVYCLPMRTLVEQTRREFEKWTDAATGAGLMAGAAPTVHVLMGGDADDQWVRDPERDAILIGTQDMLLSRALMRGYALTPYVWPIHFGLLHTDCLWLFDEVQLMGPGVATSAQLEGFRRAFGSNGLGSKSLWASATISRGWLDTVDLTSHLQNFRSLRLDGDDERRARERLRASKTVRRAQTTLRGNSSKEIDSYTSSLAGEVLDAHRPGARTLVVLNTVDRAQRLYRRLRKESSDATLLLHSRFRPVERAQLERRLREELPAGGSIVVMTQVVEAGVDISSAVLFTELCPWSSFVQRCGRCNRRGEYGDAGVHWIDVDLDVKDGALPYESPDLQRARDRISILHSAAPGDLPAFDDPAPIVLVLRKRDLFDLFSTDSDLSGFHTDVSDYIRDSDERTVQVFWRDLTEDPSPDEPPPDRNELCSTSLPALRDALKKRTAWVWDPLAPRAGGATGRWKALRQGELYPGVVVMLRSSDGAYDPDLGFFSDSRTTVPVLRPAAAAPPEPYFADPLARKDYWMRLADHLEHTRQHADRLCQLLEIDGDDLFAVTTAALWHDVGKLHEVFQDDLLRGLPENSDKREAKWAKAPRAIQQRNGEAASASLRTDPRRRFLRHELPGALAYLQTQSIHRRELVAYLIAAHHGKVRTSLRALPEEPAPPQPERRYARGVWDGDALPAFSLDGRISLGRVEISLAPMVLGGDGGSPSWAEMVGRLLAEHGPFRLAWLEALVRIADWRASAEAEFWCDEPGSVVSIEGRE
ncbi:MAG: type I-G CRISPR-associated helicase/endonuclease Cas3g [Thermoanaerobaculia bacterium]